jgi:hypothetical protein
MLIQALATENPWWWRYHTQTSKKKKNIVWKRSLHIVSKNIENNQLEHRLSLNLTGGPKYWFSPTNLVARRA